MSGPTKGMVAGQAIKSGDLTQEYEDNHARIFGTERQRVRGRFVWDEAAQAMVEVGADWQPSDRPGAPRKSEAEIYGNDVAMDGTPIDSKRKRREYMQREGVTDASDYSTGWWKKKTQERRDIREGKPQESTRQAVAEAWRRLRKP